MKEIYTDYARYNLWANKRIIDAYAALPENQLEKTLVSSFSSAKLTFLHIWDAEFLWLKRLQGISPGAFPSKNFQGGMEEVFNNVQDSSGAMLDFVQHQPETFLGKKIAFKTLSYGEHEQYAYQMIHHCLNHSTYHRGQLVTIGRQLGLEKIPATDFIYYLREKEDV
jgi:uncharacterized damage-inducible protein DinB